MAIHAFTDARLFVGGYDLTGVANEVSLDLGRRVLDASTFRGGTEQRRAGLRTVELTAAGYTSLGAGEVEAVLTSTLGVADTVVTVAGDGADDGDVAWSTRAMHAVHGQVGQHGELAAWSAKATSSQGGVNAVRGTVLHPDTASRTTTGTGTVTQLGASTGLTVYAALHVIAASGTAPTLDVVVQSAASAGFGSPSDRISFAQASDVGAQWGTPFTAGTTHQYWRASWTIGGTSPSFGFVVVVAIQ